jgi:hypothetical protein
VPIVRFDDPLTGEREGDRRRERVMSRERDLAREGAIGKETNLNKKKSEDEERGSKEKKEGDSESMEREGDRELVEREGGRDWRERETWNRGLYVWGWSGKMRWTQPRVVPELKYIGNLTTFCSGISFSLSLYLIYTFMFSFLTCRSLFLSLLTFFSQPVLLPTYLSSNLSLIISLYTYLFPSLSFSLSTYLLGGRTSIALTEDGEVYAWNRSEKESERDKERDKVRDKEREKEREREREAGGGRERVREREWRTVPLKGSRDFDCVISGISRDDIPLQPSKVQFPTKVFIYIYFFSNSPPFIYCCSFLFFLFLFCCDLSLSRTQFLSHLSLSLSLSLSASLSLSLPPSHGREGG